MVDLVDTDWRETNRSRSLVAPDLVSGVTLICVDKLVWNDAVTEEGLSVGEVGSGIAGIAGCVVPSCFRELLLCALFELGWV